MKTCISDTLGTIPVIDLISKNSSIPDNSLLWFICHFKENVSLIPNNNM